MNFQALGGLFVYPQSQTYFCMEKLVKELRTDTTSLNTPSGSHISSNNSCSAEQCCGSCPAGSSASTLGMSLSPEQRTEQIVAPDVAKLIRQATGKVVYTIQNMCCPMEEALIRKKLTGMPGVEALEFNVMQRMLTVHHSLDSLESLEKALASIGMQATPFFTNKETSSPKPDFTPPSINWLRLILAGVVALTAEIIDLVYGDTWVILIVALAAIALGGISTYKKGWVALRNFNLNMNALMSLAVTGALCIGHWPEAAMVMVLFTLAEAIEARALDRARNAIRGLMALTPDKATVQQADGSWLDTDARTVAVESRVRVKPGERIALDGEIVEGRSAINQAPVTGESLPVEKAEGDSIFAGTINTSGSFIYRVTAEAKNSTLARIIHAVEQAQGSRSPTQRFVDKFAKYYTPAIFALALAIAVVPPLASTGLWVEWIYRALVVLVIACPCALVISTPVSIVSGLAAAAKKGILIKGGVYLEEGRKLRWLALDKTGTLTHGRPVQTDAITWNNNEASTTASLAASLAARSDHPVSKALSIAAAAESVPLRDVREFAALPGQGIQGTIDSKQYFLVNHSMVKALQCSSPEMEKTLHALEMQGKSVVMLMDSSAVLGIFAVADTVKESSRIAITELHSLGVKTLMLTGDNPYTAQTIATQVGIDRACGGLLPEGKLQEIENLLSPNGKVGMVGDGINDAPALARADIGFAMGVAGTDTAIETADVALMDDDLRKIPTFIRLSQATAAILRQNIMLALGVKTIFLALTFTGHGTMWMAVFADMGTSLLVVFNGLRLLRK